MILHLSITYLYAAKVSEVYRVFYSIRVLQRMDHQWRRMYYFASFLLLVLFYPLSVQFCYILQPKTLGLYVPSDADTLAPDSKQNYSPTYIHTCTYLHTYDIHSQYLIFFPKLGCAWFVFQELCGLHVQATSFITWLVIFLSVWLKSYFHLLLCVFHMADVYHHEWESFEIISPAAATC